MRVLFVVINRVRLLDPTSNDGLVIHSATIDAYDVKIYADVKLLELFIGFSRRYGDFQNCDGQSK